MRIFAFLTGFLVVLPTIAGGQTFGGVGTRAEGMGGAFIAVADDASGVYWNPAGIATGATFDLQLSGGLTPQLGPGSDPPSAVFVGAVMPALGLSFYRTHTVLAPPDRQNEGSGEVQVRTLTTANAGVTVVQTIVSGLVIGTTARLVRGGVDPFDARTTLDFDAGAMFSVGDVRLGVAGRNLRKPGFEGGAGLVAMNRQVRVGVALTPRSLPSGIHGPFSLAFDADVTRTPGVSGDVRMAAAGGEYWMAQGRFGARAGVRWSTLDEDARAISGGLTVRLPRSLFVEGQLTKPSGDAGVEWGVGARVTF